MGTLTDVLNKEAQRRHNKLIRESELNSLQLLTEIRNLMKENNQLLNDIKNTYQRDQQTNLSDKTTNRRNEGLQRNITKKV